MNSQRLIFSNSFVGMGGIPSVTTEAGFFDDEVGTEGTGGDTNDGRVGKLEVSNGSTGRGGKEGWYDPKGTNNTQFQVLNWQSGAGVGQLDCYLGTVIVNNIKCIQDHPSAGLAMEQ